MNIAVKDIDLIVFDFDGVLTNNKVHINQDGKEWVSCSRADGLAFDVLRKIKKLSYIMSTEENNVVSARAQKLKIPVLQGIKNKAESLLDLCKKTNIELSRVMYVGNDLNDYQVMKMCGYAICPADSHQKIKEIASVVLHSNGGDGVVREILEELLELDFIKILY